MILLSLEFISLPISIILLTTSSAVSLLFPSPRYLSGCVVMGLVWNNTQLSKICFLYCFHSIEHTATVKNNAVKPFMGGH